MRFKVVMDQGEFLTVSWLSLYLTILANLQPCYLLFWWTTSISFTQPSPASSIYLLNPPSGIMLCIFIAYGTFYHCSFLKCLNVVEAGSLQPMQTHSHICSFCSRAVCAREGVCQCVWSWAVHIRSNWLSLLQWSWATVHHPNRLICIFNSISRFTPCTPGNHWALQYISFPCDKHNIHLVDSLWDRGEHGYLQSMI